MAYLEVSVYLPLKGIHDGATNWSGSSEPTAPEPRVHYGASVTTAFPPQCILAAPSHRSNPLQSIATAVTRASKTGQPISPGQAVTVHDGNPRIDNGGGVYRV